MSSESPPTRRPFFAIAIVAFLGVTAFVSWQLLARRNDPAPTHEVDGIPDGTPEQLVAYIEDQVRHLNENQQISPANEKKSLRRINKAAEKVLAANPEDETLIRKATEARVYSLGRLSAVGDKAAGEEAVRFLEQMKSHRLPEIREFATGHLLMSRATSFEISKESTREQVVQEAIAYIKAATTRNRLKTATDVARFLEYKQHNKSAGDIFAGIAKTLGESPDPNIQAMATHYRGYARRARLPSTALTVLKGTTVKGESFDWSKYRGKVVLIDFWATWCGPCRDEFPNVKRNYDKYHDRGFEVVGVSLDQERYRLTNFLRQSPLPWTTLYHPESTERHPMADHYGVDGIPFTILVGRDGKVIATNVRGSGLDDHLKRLFHTTSRVAPTPPTGGD